MSFDVEPICTYCGQAPSTCRSAGGSGCCDSCKKSNFAYGWTILDFHEQRKNRLEFVRLVKEGVIKIK